MRRMILKILNAFSLTLIFATAFSIGAFAQTAALPREPSKAARPFIVRSSQSLDDLEKHLPANKVEELYGGEGAQLHVAVQRDKDKPAGAAEVHDASDDIYYVLEGSATLTLGGRLDAPNEISPGEWRGARIIGGQSVSVNKGDLIVVPRGTPHQRDTTGRDFMMILIKIFAEPVRATSPARK
jgi:mannose-6-phosphate isomerase-like protein (cupin superfamily)